MLEKKYAGLQNCAAWALSLHVNKDGFNLGEGWTVVVGMHLRCPKKNRLTLSHSHLIMTRPITEMQLQQMLS